VRGGAVDAADSTMPTCPTCRQLAGAPETVGRLNRSRTTSRAEVLAAISDGPDNHTHSANVAGVVLVYAVDKSQPMECSFPGRHRHHNGSVIRMRCGRTMAVGWQCMKRCVHGGDEIASIVQTVDKYYGDLTLLGDVDSLAQRAKELVRLENQVVEAVQTLVSERPVVANEMRRRLHANGGSDVEVVASVPTGRQDSEGKETRRTQVYQLSNLVAWELRPAALRLAASLDGLCTDAAKLRKDESEDDIAEAARLAVRRHSLAKAEQALRERLHVAQGFFEPRNLLLAFQAAGQLEDSLQPHETAVDYPFGGKWTRIERSGRVRRYQRRPGPPDAD